MGAELVELLRSLLVVLYIVAATIAQCEQARRVQRRHRNACS
jgi:hypothetical protein